MRIHSTTSERRALPGINISIHYDEIKTIFENDIRDHPAVFDQYLQNAISNYLNQNLKYSLEAFDLAVSMHPEEAETYYYRSLLKFAMIDYRGVIDDCSKAIKIRSGFEKAILRRAIAEHQCGLFTRALDDLDWTIELDPDCGQAWYVRGIIKITMGENKNGVTDFLMAKKLGCRYGCNLYFGRWFMIIWILEQTSLI